MVKVQLNCINKRKKLLEKVNKLNNHLTKLKTGFDELVEKDLHAEKGLSKELLKLAKIASIDSNSNPSKEDENETITN